MPLSYPEVIQFLYGLRFFGTRLGLENTRQLAALAGNPQDRLRFIHVAGTNGKGSTCAMLEGIYRAAIGRVGLYTSPHLVFFGERIQVNRQPISEADVVRLVNDMLPWLDAFPREAHPTFFEVVTVMALRYFAEQQCDLVVWETGLGGRLDATNIVTPLASLITSISYDHEQWLGSTLGAIAFEKAGIIKPSVPVLTAVDAPEAWEVIEQRARALAAPLHRIRSDHLQQPPLDTAHLALLGEHQRWNAALAVATARLLADRWPVSEAQVRQALEHVQWPGRLQVVKRSPTSTLVLDGAHNPSGAEVLRAAILNHFPVAPRTLVLGVLRDKNFERICQLLAPLASRILPTPVGSERTTAPQSLVPFCRQANPQALIEPCASLAEALQRCREDRLVFLTGSLHFIGEAMELLRLAAVPKNPERRLNEWNALAPPLKKAI